mmetsp:Transcript_23700/g.36036  ORF Transcript_23700/g.36036 Transcript_23700/m.36036 type:complete len:97 (+) Transcript_23700:308-598(+)
MDELRSRRRLDRNNFLVCCPDDDDLYLYSYDGNPGGVEAYLYKNILRLGVFASGSSGQEASGLRLCVLMCSIELFLVTLRIAADGLTVRPASFILM